MKYTKVSVSMEGEVFDALIEFGLDDDLALEGHLEMPEVEMADAAGNDAIAAASDVKIHQSFEGTHRPQPKDFII